MMIIPLYTLLIIYGIFLIVFCTFFAINFFHILRTGTTTLGSFIITFIIMALSVVTLYGTWYYLKQFDWQQPLFTLNFEFIKNLLHPDNNGALF